MTHRPKCQKKGEGIMKTKPKANMKQLVARVPEEVHRALKVRAAEEGKSVAVILERLIRHYVLHMTGRCGNDCIFNDNLNDSIVTEPKGAKS